MGKFDTHGGYYAPKNYFRINEGGSHEENPNGGVQVGVDQNGVPNLLEENEPVFNDFVFSDNIKANKSILKEMSLPEKYAGMLYSEIADLFIEEAEERPMDPISNNGLNAMLGRLADAQEEQKIRKEKRELQDMINELSPEELAMLSSVVMQPEEQAIQPQMMQPQMMAPQQMIPQEQMMQEQQINPMMACGGKINSKKCGGKIYAEGSPQKMFDRVTEQILLQDAIRNAGISPETGMRYEQPLQPEYPEMDVALMAVQPGGILTKAMAPVVYKDMVNALAEGDVSKAAMLSIGNPAAPKVSSTVKTAIKSISKPSLKQTLGFLVDPTYGWRNWSKPESVIGKVGSYIGKSAQTGLATSIDSVPIGYVIDRASGATRHARPDDELWEYEDYACGGKVEKKYAKGSPYIANGFMWAPQLETSSAFPAGVGPLINTANKVTTGSRISTLPYDNSNGFAYFNNGAYDKGYLDWLNNTAFEGTDTPLWNDLSNYYKTTTGKTLTPETAIRLGQDKKFGKFHNLLGSGYADYLKRSSIGDALPKVNPITGKAVLASELPNPLQDIYDQIGVESDVINASIDDMYAADPSLYGMPSAEQLSAPGASSDELSYPTALRYAGVLGNLIGTVNNIAQKPDNYQYRPISVNVPAANIPLQMQQYNPIDMSIPMNAINAQSNTTTRAIMNSGAGPSIGAMLLANGFNTNNALGNAYLQGIQANNQQRNATIAANNAVLSQMAAIRQRENEIYSQLRQRADMQNNANALQIQMLNNQAQQAKASATGTTLENLLNGLAGIGNENFSFNMLRKFPYTIDKNGNIIYNQN